MKKIRVNIVSESEVSVKGHGVHTAYIEHLNALQKRDDVTAMRDMFTKKPQCDVHHIHTVGLRVWPRLWDKQAKKVISAHVVPESFRGSLILAKYWLWLAKIYLRWFYNQADVVLAVSDATKEELLLLGVTKPIEVMYNSIDIQRYKNTRADTAQAVRKKYKIAPDAFVVMGAGQTQPRKRLDTFIDAARQLPGMTFLWVGGMPFGRLAAEYDAVKKIIEQAPSNVHFTGTVDLQDIPHFYNASDVFMFPSVQETFGLVVVEAAASGLPVLIRDLPEYDETFGNNALRCSDKTFVSALQMLKENPSEYKKWHSRAENIAKRFDSAAAAERLVKIYQDLVYTSK